jgi:NAD+ kinase
MKKFKNILIVYRPSAPEALKLAQKTATFLKGKKLNCFSHPKQEIPKVPKLQKKSPHIDLALALGGDGTYLEAVHILQKEQIPILGVNLGSLGFLSNVRKDDFFKVLELALNGKLEARKRAMLRVRVLRRGKELGQHTCLNDVVLERGSVSQLINLSIHSEKHLVNEVKADGLVIASPTGSTAYNLSAGGPILHPHVSAIVVTPICPHSLTHRPIIFPDDQELKFKLLNEKHKAYVTIDGRPREELNPGDEVLVKRDKNDHIVLRLPSSNYFDLLRAKLKLGDREV